MSNIDQTKGQTQPETQADDIVLPFQIETAGTSGRLLRFGAVVDTILRQHAYPDPVSELLGEAVALTAMLGTGFKHDGRFILQTQTDGPVNLLVADFDAPCHLRGYASFDESALQSPSRGKSPSAGALLGKGHLAMTIDRRGERDRYQGVVPLDGASLADAAHEYFRQSEQLPTFVRLAVAKHYAASGHDGSGTGSWQWRAGALMIQNIAGTGGRGADHTDPANDPAAEMFLLGEDEEDWRRARLLAETVEPHELLDPMLSPERLLYRLFNEERVRLFAPRRLKARCRCSEPQIKQVLDSFSADERHDMTKDGRIAVTCEFCNAEYSFAPEEFE